MKWDKPSGFIEFKDMDFNQRLSYVRGRLIMSIGEGDFETTTWALISTIERLAYERGKAEGLTKAEEIKPRRRRTK